MIKSYLFVFFFIVAGSVQAQHSESDVDVSRNFNFSRNQIEDSEFDVKYKKLPIELVNQINSSLVEGELTTSFKDGDQLGHVLYEFETISWNTHHDLLICVGESKYGFTALYLSVISLQDSIVKSTIKIADNVEDAGDSHSMTSELDLKGQNLALSVHTLEKSLGEFQDDKKDIIHANFKEVYEFTNDEFSLIVKFSLLN